MTAQGLGAWGWCRCDGSVPHWHPPFSPLHSKLPPQSAQGLFAPTTQTPPLSRRLPGSMKRNRHYNGADWGLPSLHLTGTCTYCLWVRQEEAWDVHVRQPFSAHDVVSLQENEKATCYRWEMRRMQTTWSLMIMFESLIQTWLGQPQITHHVRKVNVFIVQTTVSCKFPSLTAIGTSVPNHRIHMLKP